LCFLAILQRRLILSEPRREMARLPTSGASVASLAGDLEALKRAIFDLHIDQAFDATALQDVHGKLGAVIGRWLSEQSRLDTSMVGNTLLRIAKNLSEASVLLGGLETGIHSSLEIEVASRVVHYLALDPSVGSQPQEHLASFQREAARMAHVLMVARADLPVPSADENRALLWYDDFTALLLDMAKRAGVKPKQTKDRITGLRGGWLFDAAQALEPFLWPEMRSPSPEACGKRLERSLKRLANRKRQKPRVR
jgi:hypothetical protein